MARLRRQRPNAPHSKSEGSPERRRATTSEFLCWMYQATMHARSLRSKDGSRIFAKAGFSPTTDVQLARPFVANVGTSRLLIFTSTIYAMREQAAFSKLASPSSKLRSSQDTRIGKCFGDTPT